MQSESSVGELGPDKPRVLVWGARGFIGRHLTATLVSRGWPVTIVTRPHTDPYPACRFPLRKIELDEKGLSGKIFRDAISESSIIYNFAGSSGAVASNRDPFGSLDANCRIQLAFLEACAAAGNKPHVIFSSSRLVYGETGKALVSETFPVYPQSLYAAHKLCIENYLQIYSRLGHITHTICRISNVYGFDQVLNGQGYRVVNAFIRAGLAGEPITLFGDGQQLRDFIYISDLVESLMAAGQVEASKNEILNIGSGASNSMYEAAALIQRLTSGGAVNFAPWPEEYRLVESGDYVADVSKAKSLLGVSCQFDLASGLAETVDLHRRAGQEAESENVLAAKFN